MATYVLVYKGGGMPATDAERQSVLQQWERWFGSLGQSVVDGGNPFGASKSVASDGSVRDGAGSGLTGYSILKAEDLNSATEMARGCPILSSGGTIELYETVSAM
jgi:hypothetical protein